MPDLKRQANLDPSAVPLGDWHSPRSETEPRCGADQWRARQRDVVSYMHEMHDAHLAECVRFASSMRQHASRLQGLLAEQRRRENSGPTT